MLVLIMLMVFGVVGALPGVFIGLIVDKRSADRSEVVRAGAIGGALGGIIGGSIGVWGIVPLLPMNVYSEWFGMVRDEQSVLGILVTGVALGSVILGYLAAKRAGKNASGWLECHACGKWFKPQEARPFCPSCHPPTAEEEDLN